MSKPYKLVLTIFIILTYQNLDAQLIKKDCYTTYKNQGDIYNKQQKYSQAIEQYKIAKNCKYLSRFQIKTLDNAIAVASKKIPSRNVRIITRRF